MKFNEYITETTGFFDKEADYIIREIRSGSNEYEVSKWVKGKQPEATYRCYKRNNVWNCTCPTRIKPCKHIKLVKEWIAKGKKNPYDPEDIGTWAKELFKKEK
jgi:hypothetical protein